MSDKPAVLTLTELKRRADEAGTDIELWDRDSGFVQFETEVNGEWLGSQWYDISTLPPWARAIVNGDLEARSQVPSDHNARMAERRQLGLVRF